MPTLITLAGLEAPRGVQGRDLSRLLTSDDESDFASFATSTKHRRGVYAVRTTRYKLIYDQATNTIALFDLESDPSEYRDIAREEPDVANELRSYLLAHLERNAEFPALSSETVPIRENIRKRLEALGYLSQP